MRLTPSSVCWLACLAFALALPARAETIAVGQPAPVVVLPSLTEEGRTYDLAQLKGQVVYVDFWASWCGPCRVSFPIIDEIYQELAGRGFQVLAINVDEYPEDAMEFLQALPVSYPVVRDAEGVTPAAFGIIGMPTGFLIDQQGTVVKIHQGFRKSDADWLRKEILKLLES